MHYQIVTDKQTYAFRTMESALKVLNLLKSSGIECCINAVRKSRNLKR